jgi:endoglucanase
MARKLSRTWRAWLLAPALAATGLASAPAAHADTTLCGPTSSVQVSGGQYIVQNNEWNDTIQQCINATNDGFTVTVGNHNLPTNGAPAAYPSIYAGCHYGNCSTGNGLPLQVSAFDNPQSSVNFNTAAGQWDASYDIWFDTQPFPSGQNDGEELMIWANHSGAPQPAGSRVGTAFIEGANWDVWIGRGSGGISWNIVSYVRQTPVNAITVNLTDFTNDSINRGQLNSAWYLTSVQFGFEPWQGGPGLGVNSFSFTASSSGGCGANCGGGGTGPGPITGYQGLCLDDRAASTTNFNPVQVYTCNGTGAQSWTLTSSNQLQALGKCLDVNGAGTANGTKVDLYDCNGTGAQTWVHQSNGSYLNPNSGKCLDDTGWGGSGTQAQIWACSGNSNQSWSLP